MRGGRCDASPHTCWRLPEALAALLAFSSCKSSHSAARYLIPWSYRPCRVGGYVLYRMYRLIECCIRAPRVNAASSCLSLENLRISEQHYCAIASFIIQYEGAVSSGSSICVATTQACVALYHFILAFFGSLVVEIMLAYHFNVVQESESAY